MRYVPDGSLCTASAEQIFSRDNVQRNCFELALYTTRDHGCISNRIGSGVRNCPRCRCRLATSGARPTPSTIDRAIIMLNDHRFWGHASGPSSSVRRSHRSIHCWHGHAACRSALPRERFSPLTLIGHWPVDGRARSTRATYGFHEDRQAKPAMLKQLGSAPTEQLSRLLTQLARRHPKATAEHPMEMRYGRKSALLADFHNTLFKGTRHAARRGDHRSRVGRAKTRRRHASMTRRTMQQWE